MPNLSIYLCANQVLRYLEWKSAYARGHMLKRINSLRRCISLCSFIGSSGFHPPALPLPCRQDEKHWPMLTRSALGAPPIPRSPPEPALVNLQTPSTVVRQWEEPRTALLADALWINYVLLRGQSLSSFLSNIPWNDNDDRAPSSQLVRSGAFTNSIKVLLSRSMQCAHVDCTRKSKKLYDTNVMCGKGTAQTLY